MDVWSRSLNILLGEENEACSVVVAYLQPILMKMKLSETIKASDTKIPKTFSFLPFILISRRS